MGVKDKVLEVRYWTYYLIFPDGDEWVQQEPFVHDLQFELQNSVFEMEPSKKRDLLVHGETHWKDHNGIVHRVRIENEAKPRRWGVGRPKMIARKGPRRPLLGVK